MSKCVYCHEPYGEHFFSEYFCTLLCKALYAEAIGEMAQRLCEDENLISAFDHIQLLLKKEAQGGEES